MHDNQVSKIKFVKIYDLLPEEQLKFLIKLSEIRNRLVHKFENIDFSFLDEIKSFDKNQKKSWGKMLTWYNLPSDTITKYQKLSIEKPRIAVWFSVFMFVSLTIVKINEIKGMSKIDEVAVETTKKLLDIDE